MGLRKKPLQSVAPAEPLAEERVRSQAELLAALRAGSPADRRVAARDLAAHPDAAEELVAQLAVESDRAVREMIGTSLVAIGSPQTPALVAPLLRADDATLRNDAREALLLLPGAEEVARTLLADEEPEVRMFAVEILAARLGAEAGDEIAELLEKEADVNVSGLVCEKLGEIGGVRHIDALQSVRERVDPDGFLAFVVEDVTERILERSATRSASSEA